MGVTQPVPINGHRQQGQSVVLTLLYYECTKSFKEFVWRRRHLSVHSSPYFDSTNFLDMEIQENGTSLVNGQIGYQL